MIRRVRGNNLTLIMSLTQRLITQKGETLPDYIPASDDKITLYMRGLKKVEKEVTVNGNKLYWDASDLSCGIWGTEVIITKKDGTKLRCFNRFQLLIVESTDELQSDTVSELYSDSAELNASIFVFAKGDKGDPLTYSDLTDMQKKELQKPAQDIADSFTARMDKEESDRTNGDSNLQGAISTEIKARENGDSALANRINEEVEALQNGIDVTNKSVTDILGSNPTDAINNLNEIISFLNGFKDNETLAANLKTITDRITGVEGVAIKELHLTSSAPINCTGAVPMGAVAGVEPAAGLYRVKTMLPSSADASFGLLVVSDTGGTIMGKKYTFIGYGGLDGNGYIVPSTTWNIIHGGIIINHDVVQSAGTSTTAVMSQKAVGDYINSGARIGSLTETSSDDTWNLEFEVNDGSALTKKIKGSTLLNGLENTFSYGIEFDTAISSPNCTRIGNPELHRTLPIQSKMRGCLLDDSGTVVDYLDENDWSSNVLDGSKGQIMVELPKHYIKFETEGTKRRVRLSEYPLAGYHIVEKCYVSAYEATIDRTNNKLASVVNTTAQFRGGNNQADWDALSKTQLGKPATNISLTNFRAYARNRGSMEWNCYTYQIQRKLFWLFAVEYANFNSQDAYNAALTVEGYKQGGLSDGVTTLDGTRWSNFNGYYPFIPCGYTNSLGNKTGVVSFTMPFEYDSNGSANYIGEYNAATAYVAGNYVSSGTSLYVCILASTGNAVTNTTYFTPVTRKTVNVPSYRGVENPFGHLWKWTDGCKCMIQSDASGGISEFYVCDTPANFTSSGTTNYQLRGNLPRVGGYVKEVILGEYGEIMPLSVGGGSTTYFCDNFYTSKPASGIDERGVLFGGGANTGAFAGFVCASANFAASYAYSYFGSRLCFIPQIIN